MIGLSELTVLFLLGLLAIPSILTFIDIMRSNFEGGGKDILASFCNILVASLKLCMTHLPGLSGSFRLVQSTLSRTS